MIDTKSIREYLLEAAIHGRLSDNTIEGNQKDILQQIESDYRSLLEAKETKAIVEVQMIEEGLFDLPNNWIWVSLSKLCVLLSRGKSPKYSENKKYPVFAQKCNQPSGLALEKALFLDEATLDKWQTFFRLVDGDVLINSTGTGTMGRVGCFDCRHLNPNYPFMLPDSHVTVARLGKGIIPRFIYYVLRSPSLQRIMEKQFRGSTNQKEFYIDSVAAMPIPFPPTVVQEQIVSLLDKANLVLDSIDDLQAKYANNLTILKSKLIDAAIQGKLTEQLPEDGTAEELYQQVQMEKQALIKAGKIKKEKPLPEITSDEVPFEIPANWKWIRWGELSNQIQYGYNAPGKETGRIRMVRITDIQGNKVNWSSVPFCDIAEEDIEGYRLQPNDILFARTGGTVGKSYMVETVEEDSVFAGYLIRTSYSNDLNAKYMKYFMESRLYWKQLQDGTTATAQPNCNAKTLSKMMLPLPPKEEQDRIVTRLDALNQLIDSSNAR